MPSRAITGINNSFLTKTTAKGVERLWHRLNFTVKLLND